MEKAEKHLHLLSLELMRTHSLGWLTRRKDTAVSCKKVFGTPDTARNSLKKTTTKTTPQKIHPKPTEELGYDLSWSSARVQIWVGRTAPVF